MSLNFLPDDDPDIFLPEAEPEPASSPPIAQKEPKKMEPFIDKEPDPTYFDLLPLDDEDPYDSPEIPDNVKFVEKYGSKGIKSRG
jgi:hypothetical protein